jgi:4-hydroxybenzoate polyprenyltransferase
MIYQANHLLHLDYDQQPLYFFAFFSTICSYNFHWYLTPATQTEIIRAKWTQDHKRMHLVLYGIGLIGSAWYGLQLIDHWFWLSGAVLLTFLYSAPKLPFKPFIQLRKVAVGKTIFLSFVWMYVTSFLPVAISTEPFQVTHLLFCASRFFLVYSICIIFDYRDRENDRREGIKSMITLFTEKGIDRLFYFSILLFFVSTFLLYLYGFSFIAIVFLMLPGLAVLLLYNYSKRSFSDYLYYFVLDGLMMCSALFTSLLSI